MEELPGDPVSPSAQKLRVASAFQPAAAAAGAVVAVVAPAPPVDEVIAAADDTQTLRPLGTGSIMRRVWVESDS